MKLGFVSAILGDNTFEEMIDIAQSMGFSCVEVACWPNGKAERRYAGVSHIDCKRVVEDDQYAAYIKGYCEQKKITISSLAYYPNVLDEDEEKSSVALAHLKNVILASKILGVNMVTTFIGRQQSKTVEDNLKVVEAVWSPIMELAKENSVKIAIENCPMLFGAEQWPGGQNIMTTPDIWKKIFEILPYDNLGLNYDPSHFVWQMMDYVQPIYDFKDKIFHVHYKDIKVYEEKLKKCGIMAYPLDYMSPKLPGLGDVDWGKYVSALTDIGYNGCSCIEVEDKAFEGSKERILDSLYLSKKYMDNFVI